MNLMNRVWKQDANGKGREKRSSQGKDPRTFEGNSQVRDPSTFEGKGHQAKRWRVQKKRKEEKWRKRKKMKKNKKKKVKAQQKETVEEVQRAHHQPVYVVSEERQKREGKQKK